MFGMVGGVLLSLDVQVRRGPSLDRLNLGHHQFYPGIQQIFLLPLIRGDGIDVGPMITNWQIDLQNDLAGETLGDRRVQTG